MKTNILLSSALVLLAANGCSDSNDATKLLWPRGLKDTSGIKTSSYLVTASSKSGVYGPEGLFGAVQPGWHAASPPNYPETVTVDFKAVREVKFVDLLQQDGHPERAPGSVRIEVSNDGKTWAQVGGSDDTCTPNESDGWVNIDLAKPVTTQYLKVVIDSNCGDSGFLTFRGLNVGDDDKNEVLKTGAKIEPNASKVELNKTRPETPQSLPEPLKKDEKVSAKKSKKITTSINKEDKKILSSPDK